MSVNVTSQEITIYNLAVNILDIYLHVLEESKSKNKNPYQILIYVFLFLNKV